MKREPERAISTEALIRRIEGADDREMEAILGALQRRYKCLFPGWSVSLLSVPTGDAERRKEQARMTIDFIRRNFLEE